MKKMSVVLLGLCMFLFTAAAGDKESATQEGNKGSGGNDILEKMIVKGQMADVDVEAAKFKPLKKGETLYGELDSAWGKIPGILNNCEFSYVHKHAGVTTLTVKKDGIVIIAVSTRWGGGGNSSGSWQQELTTQEELLKNGWVAAGSLLASKYSDAEGPLLFCRESKAGEKFKLRTEKYIAPIVIKRTETAEKNLKSNSTKTNKIDSK